MKVGVIGAGNWGMNLVRTFHELGALGAVAELVAERRDKVAQSYPDVAVYAEHRALVETDIPAVAIATPAATHYAVARECLVAGKDVFVEKPMTLSVPEAEELVELAGEQKRVLMVGHLLLYQPGIQCIKRYLDSGELGQLYSLHQERLNLGRARSEENALWSLGVHDVAVLLYLVGGPPCRVEAWGQPALQPTVEDDVYLHLEFAGGVQAHLHASWLWPEKRRWLTVVGSRGMLVYNEVEQTVALHRKRIDEKLQNQDEGSEILYQGTEQPLRFELEHFLTCCAERSTPLSDGRSGVEVLRILDQAERLLKE